MRSLFIRFNYFLFMLVITPVAGCIRLMRWIRQRGQAHIVESCNRCGRQRKDWKYCKRCGNPKLAQQRTTRRSLRWFSIDE